MPATSREPRPCSDGDRSLSTAAETKRMNSTTCRFRFVASAEVFNPTFVCTGGDSKISPSQQEANRLPAHSIRQSGFLDRRAVLSTLSAQRIACRGSSSLGIGI